MKAFILVGTKQSASGPVPECLYCGLDGVELEKMAKLAAESKEYTFLGRLVNPSCAPMPIDPTPTVGTTPKFPRNVEKLQAQRLQPSPQYIRDRDNKLAKQRQDRLAPTPAKEVKAADVPAAAAPSASPAP